MLLVGLTGGIASGKSQVLGILGELGARTIDADAISHEQVGPGSAALKAVVEAFGLSYLLPDGSLDRRRLADLVFADSSKRARLEAILHPLIGDEIAARIERLAAEDPGAVIVVDVPLLFEIDARDDFDEVLLVYADEATRIERLMARDRLDRGDAHRRLEAQLPLEDKVDMADFVVDNSGSREETRRQVLAVYERFVKEAGKQGSR